MTVDSSFWQAPLQHQRTTNAIQNNTYPAKENRKGRLDPVLENHRGRVQKGNSESIPSPRGMTFVQMELLKPKDIFVSIPVDLWQHYHEATFVYKWLAVYAYPRLKASISCFNSLKTLSWKRLNFTYT